MIPPFFDDLLKEAKTVLKKGYNLGFLKLEGFAKSDTGVSFHSTSRSKEEDGTINGSLSTLYRYSENIKIFEKWTTDNVIATEITLMNYVNNLKNMFGFKFCSNDDENRSGYLTAKYFADPFTINCYASTKGTMDLAASAHLVNTLSLGGKIKYDFNSQEVTNYKAIARFVVVDDVILGVRFKKEKDLSVSVFYKALPDLKTTLLVKAINSGGDSYNFEAVLGCRYYMDDVSTLSAKILTTKEFGIAYYHTIKNCSVGISALFDCSDFANGKHQAGFSFVVDV